MGEKSQMEARLVNSSAILTFSPKTGGNVLSRNRKSYYFLASILYFLFDYSMFGQHLLNIYNRKDRRTTIME